MSQVVAAPNGFRQREGELNSKDDCGNFMEQKELFLLDVKAVAEMEDVPSELIFNWDQTGISIVPGSSWTMDVKGAKHVQISGIGDKRKITALFCGMFDGNFLPPQLIYQGKTTATLPHVDFPKDWHMACTPNHGANETTMKEFIKIVIQHKHKELKLSDDHSALAIFNFLKVYKLMLYAVFSRKTTSSLCPSP